MYILLANVHTVLDEQFVGMYLYGSLASGDFNPERSDVDFLVVTAEPLPESICHALEGMHQRIASLGMAWCDKLEGSYISRMALRCYDPENSVHPSFWNGKFGLDHHHRDWVIHLHLIRERGIAIAGPNPRELIDPISIKELKLAAEAGMVEKWSPYLEDASPLQDSAQQVKAILTICRMLYIMANGEVVSKPIAARWAQEALESMWADLIASALAWHSGMAFDRTSETMDFIRYTLERSKEHPMSF